MSPAVINRISPRTVIAAARRSRSTHRRRRRVRSIRLPPVWSASPRGRWGHAAIAVRGRPRQPALAAVVAIRFGSARGRHPAHRTRYSGRTIPATLPVVSHPSLGREPRDLTAGFPDAADRLRTSRGRIAARSLDIALADREGMRERYDELGLRKLLRDAEVLVDRLALSVAANDPYYLREYAVWTDIVYRRRGVPMDDLVAIVRGHPHRVDERAVDGGAGRGERSARRGDRGLPLEPPPRRRRPQAERRPAVPLQGRLSVTIKWVKVDPLVMNGEPFCYGSRLTVRQLLELRSNGYGLTRAAQGPPRAAASSGSRRPTRSPPTTASATPTSSRPTARWPGRATARRRRPACPSSTGCRGS